ncbi:MAG: hypothetical protein JWQ64_346 [Subtercola sp.]|nr:hypothetical protein [Subtercola sp.]
MQGEIESAFRSFDDISRASADERARLLDARGRAVDALAGDSRILRAVDVGSYRHGTEVGGRSWFDVVVVLAGKPTSAAKATELVTSALQRGGGSDAVVAAPGFGEVSVSGTGVAPNGAVHGPGVRLIPGFEAPLSMSAGGGDVVLVPDAAKRWVVCRVGARETLLNRIDDGNLRPLIRLILAWKHRAGVDVSSYYLETAVITQALQQPSFSILWDLCWTLEQLVADDMMNLTDVSSPLPKQKVRAAASLAKRIEASYPLQAAASAVRAAVNAYLDEDAATVNERLGAVFGPDFPEV